MPFYLPDHLVRCLICQNLFSDARRLRCSCVYCYSCCLKLVDNLTIHCRCSVQHRFHSKDELEKAFVIDTVVNDLVCQHIKQKQTKSIDNNIESLHSHRTNAENIRTQQIAVVQPACSICKFKQNRIHLCQHCQNDICELCLNKHYQIVINHLQTQWIQCQEKFKTINQHVFLSHENQIHALTQLNTIKQTIDDRCQHLKRIVNQHRMNLTDNIDNYVDNFQQLIQTNNVDDKYQSIKQRLPQILEGETNTSDLLTFLDEIKQILNDLIQRNKQMKEMEMKMPYLSPVNSFSLNLKQLIGELKFDDQLSSLLTTKLTINGNYQTTISPLMSIQPENGQSIRQVRTLRNARTVPYSSHQTKSIPRNNRHRNRRGYSYRGRISSRSRPSIVQSYERRFDIVPNNQYQWSIDVKEIPYFLSVLDNRKCTQQLNNNSHSNYDYLLFIADDYGQMNVFNLSKSSNHIQPTRIGTNELFPKNSRLLMESFAVYEFAIIVYVRRFEQRTNEIEHSKLIKAGLPIMKGEQGRCNDHGGMIYLFSHTGEQIDGVYQSHPIRIILADSIFGRLWALNPMENHLYSYMIPNTKSEIRQCLQDEQIAFDFSQEQFEPTIMFQSNQSIGFIDNEHNIYRLYKKDDRFHLLTTYENSQETKWKLTNGLIFKDNRTLLKMIEHNHYSNDRFEKTNSRRYLIELTANGEEQHRIQADTLYSMTLGPNDELILGFAVRGDHGLIHCY